MWQAFLSKHFTSFRQPPRRGADRACDKIVGVSCGEGMTAALNDAYELGDHLTKYLRLAEKPLEHLPLAVWQERGCTQASYAFPSCTGKWVAGQKATDAAIFLLRYLRTHHHELCCINTSRQNSLQFALSLLRCLRPCLPNRDDVMARLHSVSHTRLSFRDGWLDTSTLQFHALPYRAEHMVFRAAVPFCYADLMQVQCRDIDVAMQLLTQYFPYEQERAWLLRYLGRCLCPADGCKSLVVFTDSLGSTPGNAGKSSFLSWLHEAMGPASSTIASGQTLTLARSPTAWQKTDSPAQPLVRVFDELTQCTGRSAKQQLDYGSLKYMCSGQRNRPATIIAANTSDLPSLKVLQGKDPAFVDRLVMLPARARFDGKRNAHLPDQLVIALARVLVTEFANYKSCGSQLLQMPDSMWAFKNLVMRSSALTTVPADHVAAAMAWFKATLAALDDDSWLPSSVVCHTQHGDLFKAHWLRACPSRMTDKAMEELADSVLASHGVAASADKYVGVSLRLIAP